MLVSHKHRFIFIKQFKVAGTSVEKFFEPFCLPDGEVSEAEKREVVTEAGIVGLRHARAREHASVWWNHMPAAEIRSKLGAELFDSYLKFSVMRNPFDKLLSLFFFEEYLSARTGRSIDQSTPDVGRFAVWFRGRQHLNGDRQHIFINGNCCVDFFIRFERLHDDCKALCSRLGLPFDWSRMPHEKGGIRPPAQGVAVFYTPDMIERVLKEFDWEVNKMGYVLPP